MAELTLRDRFVILRHETPPHFSQPSHWDWMLERDGRLATWSTSSWPSDARTPLPVPAHRLPDHRAAYLDYEGPVRGDRGVVRAVDRGRYLTEHWSDECVRVQLMGSSIAGELVIQRDADGEWALSFNQSRNESARRDRP